MGGKINGACWEFAQIDNLTYSYTAGTNKISSISDAAVAVWKDKGFKDGSTASYAYDVNGNMTTDPDKSNTISYNHLNLPRLFTWTAGSFKGNSIEILYDAAGTKLRKTVKTGATVNYTQDYIGGIEYLDGAREAIYTAEGRVKYTSPTATRYEYSIKDHLGNTRISFSDLNGNGVVNETNVVATNEVLQENHYYPFGLNTEGPWMNDAILDNNYQYNGKELNDDFGLNLNDYGARWYDGSVGRFTVVDRFAEKYLTMNPFQYGANSPINFIDVNGDSLYVGANRDASFEDVQSLVAEKYRSRLSLDQKTGKVSFDAAGLKTKKTKDGSIVLKDENLNFMNKLVNGEDKFIYENAETMTIQQGEVNVISNENGVQTAVLTNFHDQTNSTAGFPDMVYSTTPIAPYESGDWKNKVTSTKSFIQFVHIPQSGFDGQTAVHPDVQVDGSPKGRRDIVRHAIREMYFRTSESLPYRSAHEKAGGGHYKSGQITIGNKTF